MSARDDFSVDGMSQGDEVFCACCEKVREAKVIDLGYGPTEFWGSWSNHVALTLVCGHCESDEISIPEEEEVED